MSAYARLFAISCLALAACNSRPGSSDGAAGASGTAGTGGGGLSGSGGAAGGGGDGGNAACVSAVAMQPCSAEGTTCGGESCTDICQFCNLVRCTNGVWQAMEVAPAPCFSCGSENCRAYNEYCEITLDPADASGVRHCRPTPAACQAAPMCDCLIREVPLTRGQCSVAGAGVLLVVLPPP